MFDKKVILVLLCWILDGCAVMSDLFKQKERFLEIRQQCLLIMETGTVQGGGEMVIVNLAFFIFILIASIYILFIKSKNDVLKRYLSFIIINSFFFFSIFDIKSVLWITLICAIGLILHTKSPIKDKVIFIFIVIFIFVIYRVPTSPAEFETYLIEEHAIHCSVVECVEVVEIVNDNKLQMQATKYAIQGLTFDWYFVFSQGQIVLNNENIKAINIAGFWIQINK